MRFFTFPCVFCVDFVIFPTDASLVLVSIYMVTSGRHYNDGCCFDYGNAELGTWPNTTNNLTFAKGLMEVNIFEQLLLVTFCFWCVHLVFGAAADAFDRQTVYWGSGYDGKGKSLVQSDQEMGVYVSATGYVLARAAAHAVACALLTLSLLLSRRYNASYKEINASFVTAMVKGDAGNHWTIKWADAQSGSLHTAFDGARPGGHTGDYNPMKKPGGLILGMGGDTSNSGESAAGVGAVSSVLSPV